MNPHSFLKMTKTKTLRRRLLPCFNSLRLRQTPKHLA